MLHVMMMISKNLGQLGSHCKRICDMYKYGIVCQSVAKRGKAWQSVAKRGKSWQNAYHLDFFASCYIS